MRGYNKMKKEHGKGKEESRRKKEIEGRRNVRKAHGWEETLRRIERERGFGRSIEERKPSRKENKNLSGEEKCGRCYSA
jgi:hypothetical protein